MGIGISLLLCIPISAIIRKLSGRDGDKRVYQVTVHAVTLVLSATLTLIAGHHPVAHRGKTETPSALRTETRFESSHLAASWGKRRGRQTPHAIGGLKLASLPGGHLPARFSCFSCKFLLFAIFHLILRTNCYIIEIRTRFDKT